MPNDTSSPALAVNNLSVAFKSKNNDNRIGLAVRGISFDLHPGKTLCLVGESGCGKSVTALAIMRLLQSPPALLSGKSIILDGIDLLSCPLADMTHIRGQRMGMIFQDPMTSLNPVMRIGTQLEEPLRLHKKLTPAQAQKRAIELLDMVGIPEPAQKYRYFPHQLSGGMRQRVMIAAAISCEPTILIADEPTTALDVTIQRQILELLKTLVMRTDTALLLITHDFNVVEQIADTVAVMYAGNIVEQGDTTAVLENPLHPYTKGLLAARPHMHGARSSKLTPGKRTRLTSIPGQVPRIWQTMPGCYFAPRCALAIERCHLEQPEISDKYRNRLCRCWLA